MSDDAQTPVLPLADRCGEAPRTVDELMARADAIAGRRMSTVAAAVGETVVPHLRRDKGWVGRVIETWLGGTAANRSVPDFEALDIELKTLPIGRNGRPRETTYVCTVSVDDLDTTWPTSRVRHKLGRVLWIPVEGEPSIAPGERHVGAPLLWSPSREEEALLRRDWQEHMALIGLGRIDHITAHHGVVLQMRPKAANARQRGWGIDDEGLPERVSPRGFYLRTDFTAALLARHFEL